MASKRILGMPAATLPLVGANVATIVQGTGANSNKKVTLADMGIVGTATQILAYNADGKPVGDLNLTWDASNIRVTAGVPGTSGAFRTYSGGGSPPYDWLVTLDGSAGQSGSGKVGFFGGGTGDEPVFEVGGQLNYIQFFPAVQTPRAVDTVGLSVGNFPNFYSFTPQTFFPDGAGDNAIDLGSQDDPTYGTVRWRTGYFGTSVVIGDTPFTFSETAGVLELGDPKLTWNAATLRLLVDGGEDSALVDVGEYGRFIWSYENGDPAMQIVQEAELDGFAGEAVGIRDGEDGPAGILLMESFTSASDWRGAIFGPNGSTYGIVGKSDGTNQVSGPPLLFETNSFDFTKTSIAISNAGAGIEFTINDTLIEMDGDGFYLGTGNSKDIGISILPWRTGYFGTSVKITPCAVGDLGSAATAGAGAKRVVNDALLPAFGATVANGGAVTVPVFSDGTNWKVG